MTDDDPKPFYTLLRNVRDTVGVMLANDWTVEAVRADLIPRACNAIDEVPEPFFSSLRSLIVRTVDDAICQAHQLEIEG